MKEGYIMQWQILIGPVVGAFIGYLTNKIAVKMLFRPLKPIYIGKFHLPFTPGIIPKGKERLGKAIGNAVGNNLLTSTTIKESLLSKKMEDNILEQLDLLFTNLSCDSSSLESTLYKTLGEPTTLHLKTAIQTILTEKIYINLQSMDLGETVSNEVMSAVQEKVKNTMFSIMLNDSTLSPIIDAIKVRVNQYIADNAEDKVAYFIQNELVAFVEQPLSDLFVNINQVQLKLVILNSYHSLVNNHIDSLLDSLDFSQIIEDKVSTMEVQDVEKLVLSIMEKELGTIVNLGALIGFILGLINMFF
jgi:uncharacterized membrane protein YheB (UPF0754 family)